MKNHNLLLVTLLLCLFWSSCSVQQRRYRKGFYVSGVYKRNNPANVRPCKEVNAVVCISNALPQLLPEKDSERISKVLTCEGAVQYPNAGSLHLAAVDRELRPLPAPAIKTELGAGVGRKADWLGIAAFVISIASWFSTGWLALPLFALAAILAVISLRKIALAPERYVLKTLSLVALIVALTGVLLSSYMLIVILFS